MPMIRGRDVRWMLLLSVAVPAIAVAQRPNAAQTVTRISSEDLKLACGVNVQDALRGIPGGNAMTTPAMECNEPSAIYLGMDAGFFHLKDDGADEGSNNFALPLQAFRVDFPVGRQFRLEVPLSLSYSKVSGSDASTSLTTGLIGDFFLNTLMKSTMYTTPNSGLYAGVGGLLNYESDDGDSHTQTAVIGRLGYEVPVNDMRLRLQAAYEKRFEKDEIPASNGFGVTVGLGVPISGEMYTPGSGSRSIGSSYVQIGVQAEHSSVEDYDGETKIDIPGPYVGFFFKPGSMPQLGIGARASFNWAKQGDFSAHDLDFIPRLEYSLNPDYLTKKGVQLGAQFLIENFNLDYGTGSVSGTQLGVGGDVSLTIPHAPTVWRVGIGVDRMFEDKDGGRPAATVIRIEFGLDRHLLR